MAVTLGNTSSGQVTLAASLTVAHTIAAGDNKAAYCITYSRSRDVTGVTYGGSAMTDKASDVAFQGYIHLWAIAAPASGAQNVVATASGGDSDITLRTIDFSNVDQVVLLDNPTSGHTSGTSLSVSATTIDADTYIVGGGSIETNTTLVSSTGATLFGELLETGRRSSGGYEAIATPASEAMGWTAGSSGIMLAVIGAVAEAATGPTNLKSLNTNVKANIKSYNTNLIANIKSVNTNV